MENPTKLPKQQLIDFVNFCADDDEYAAESAMYARRGVDHVKTCRTGDARLDALWLRWVESKAKYMQDYHEFTKYCASIQSEMSKSK